MGWTRWVLFIRIEHRPGYLTLRYTSIMYPGRTVNHLQCILTEWTTLSSLHRQASFEWQVGVRTWTVASKNILIIKHLSKSAPDPFTFFYIFSTEPHSITSINRSIHPRFHQNWDGSSENGECWLFVIHGSLMQKYYNTWKIHQRADRTNKNSQIVHLLLYNILLYKSCIWWLNSDKQILWHYCRSMIIANLDWERMKVPSTYVL